MKKILVMGAGKSATSLIDYITKEQTGHDWQLIVADSNLGLAQSKIPAGSNAKALILDAENDTARKGLIEQADIVISMLPPSLHYLVAEDCLSCGKNLLTASYIDEKISQLSSAISEKGLLFLGEMGLDPGIDHMSAMQLIHQLKNEGAVIKSFVSHCGGLVAPESDDNPWHYKISWNPRNVVMAGKSGATFKKDGQIQHLVYEELFDASRVIQIPGMNFFAWYPNRDSLSYVPVYGLEEADTFLRTTLRYPEFCFGWKNVIDLKLTDETVQYKTNGMTLQSFFQQHFSKYGFSEWIEKQLTARFAQTRQLLEKLQQLLEAEQEVGAAERKELQEFMMVDDNGSLMDINLDQVKTQAAATVAGQMHEANLSMKQLVYLGMDDDATCINRGDCSAADVLQFALEKKLLLHPADKDMIVMLHEVEYQKEGSLHKTNSCLVVKGEDHLHTAMAKTVGLPLGIATKLILEGKITTKGLHIPVIPEIYEPVLKELAVNGIVFMEV